MTKNIFIISTHVLLVSYSLGGGTPIREEIRDRKLDRLLVKHSDHKEILLDLEKKSKV